MKIVGVRRTSANEPLYEQIHLRGESFANGLSVEMVLHFHSFQSAVSKRHPMGVKNCFFFFCFRRVISEKMSFSSRLL